MQRPVVLASYGQTCCCNIVQCVTIIILMSRHICVCVCAVLAKRCTNSSFKMYSINHLSNFAVYFFYICNAQLYNYIIITVQYRFERRSLTLPKIVSVAPTRFRSWCLLRDTETFRAPAQRMKLSTKTDVNLSSVPFHDSS